MCHTVGRPPVFPCLICTVPHYQGSQPQCNSGHEADRREAADACAPPAVVPEEARDTQELERDDMTQRPMQHLRAVLGFLGSGTGKGEMRRQREQIRTEAQRAGHHLRGRRGKRCEFLEEPGCFRRGQDTGQQCHPVLKYNAGKRAGPQLSAE